jgi:hypothetical protein
MSTAFHPRTDGQTERAIRVLQEALRAYVNAEQSDWDEHLLLVEFGVNSSYQAAIGTIPFMMDYGQTPLAHIMLDIVKANPAARSL